MKAFLLLLWIPVFFSAAPAAAAGLSVPHVFGAHMVLQQEQKVAVWGKASPGAEVRVEFKDQKTTAAADPEGRWKAWIQTGAADAKGSTLVITSGRETLTLEDVLVGEVWFASGQSNMAF